MDTKRCMEIKHCAIVFCSPPVELICWLPSSQNHMVRCQRFEIFLLLQILLCLTSLMVIV